MNESNDTPRCIEEIEPVYWNSGVTAHVEANGQVVVEVVDSMPMALTPHPFIPSV